MLLKITLVDIYVRQDGPNDTLVSVPGLLLLRSGLGGPDVWEGVWLKVTVQIDQVMQLALHSQPS